VRPLGQGGFADVFLFQQDMPRRLVAIKVLHARIDDAAAARALAAEADVLAGLSAHPSILTLYEASVSADGRPYMVTEFCPASLTNRYRAEQMPLDEVLSIGVRLASAVETAHKAGLLHRDIKPSNILITSFGNPVLGDFGVSTAIAKGEGDEVAMSVPWSAPEVVDQRSSGTVASEVWALAATVFTLLAQRTPFEIPGQRRTEERDLKARIMRAKYELTGRSDVPEKLEQVLEGGMRRIPGDRYPTAASFGVALQDVQRLMGLPVTALEIPTDAWASAAATSADVSEDRGPVRSTVPVASRRSGHTTHLSLTGSRRSAPQRSRPWGWIAAFIGVTVVALVAVVVAVMASGG
jgi:serine/threonine protein kinase